VNLTLLPLIAIISRIAGSPQHPFTRSAYGSRCTPSVTSPMLPRRLVFDRALPTLGQQPLPMQSFKRSKRSSTGSQVLSLMLLFFCLLLAVVQLGSGYSSAFSLLDDLGAWGVQGHVQRAKEGMEILCAFSKSKWRRLRTLAMHRAGIRYGRKEQPADEASQGLVSVPLASQLMPIRTTTTSELQMAPVQHKWQEVPGTNVFGSLLLPYTRGHWWLQDWARVASLQELQRAAVKMPVSAQKAAVQALHGCGQSMAASKEGIRRVLAFVEPIGSGVMLWSKPSFSAWTAASATLSTDDNADVSDMTLLCCAASGALLVVGMACYAIATRRPQPSARPCHGVSSNVTKSQEVWPSSCCNEPYMHSPSFQCFERLHAHLYIRGPSSPHRIYIHTVCLGLRDMAFP
jgi:hypothetical protein